MAKKDAALLKRQQIAKANRTMFIWIIGASVVLGAAGVSSVFMARKAIFNNKILAAQNKTIKTLKANNDTVDKLRENVRLLNTDESLADAKSFSDEQPIRVILDALPDDENIPALGASIQKELVNVPGVDLESLSFSGISATGSADPNAVVAESTIPFDMKLVADKSGSHSPTEKLKMALENLEKSIRAISITSMKLEVSNSGATLTVSAIAYYQPAVSLELKNVTVKP